MRILGFQKTTLLDYPHKLAATIFLGGCNFSCPFCHNASLVKNASLIPLIEEDVLSYLKKRKNILEGVCITGGEPTLSDGLVDLIKKIKNLGFCVKLDTNGSNPDLLSTLINDKLIDYVAMDIKNSLSKYQATIGCPVNLEYIQKSVTLLISSQIEYEFRTTVVRELHTKEDLLEIAKWIQPTKQYFLQQFVDSGNLLCPNSLTSYSEEELLQISTLLKEQIPNIKVRGINQPI